MKKFINKISNGMKKMVNSAKAFTNGLKERCASTFTATKAVMAGNVAEGYVDSAIKIIIAVVIGGLLLAGLYTLFNSTVIPSLTTKVTEMFSYSGT